MRRNIAFALVCAFLTWGLPAASAADSDHVAKIYVASLDAALADVERLGSLGPVSLTRQQILEKTLGALGIADLSVIDGSRPLAAVLPLEGLMLGDKGLVGLVPVEDPGAALKALVDAVGSHEVDGELHLFSVEGGNSLVARLQDGYLIVGVSRELVSAVDLDAVAERGDLPVGNLAIEILVEPLVPLAQMGIMAGRQLVQQQLANDADRRREAGEATGEAEGRGAVPAFDPRAMAGVLDLYFDLLQDGLNNAASVQISVEVSAEELMLHKRLLPRAGSTLDGLLQAQETGFPDIAGFLDVADSVGAVAGRVGMTPAFEDALQGYLERYATALQAVTEAAGSEEASRIVGTMMGSFAEHVDEWIACYRGDFAASYDFDPESGLRLAQVLGARDPESCRRLIADVTSLVETLPPGPDGGKMISVTEDALRYRGVTATRQETRVMLPATAASQREAREMVRWLFGEEPIATYTGISGDLVLSTTGGPAESLFKELVDRVSVKKRKKKRWTGVSSETFAPLRAGAGGFAFIDLPRLFRSMPESLTGPDARIVKALGEIQQGEGRVVYGSRLDADALNVTVGVPLGLLEAMATASTGTGEGEGAAD